VVESNLNLFCRLYQHFEKGQWEQVGSCTLRHVQPWAMSQELQELLARVTDSVGLLHTIWFESIGSLRLEPCSYIHYYMCFSMFFISVEEIRYHILHVARVVSSCPSKPLRFGISDTRTTNPKIDPLCFIKKNTVDISFGLGHLPAWPLWQQSRPKVPMWGMRPAAFADLSRRQRCGLL
jgi:hypothetical protein